MDTSCKSKHNEPVVHDLEELSSKVNSKKNLHYSTRKGEKRSPKSTGQNSYELRHQCNMQWMYGSESQPLHIFWFQNVKEFLIMQNHVSLNLVLCLVLFPSLFILSNFNAIVFVSLYLILLIFL